VIIPKEIEGVLEYEDINNSIRKLIRLGDLEDGIDTVLLEGEELSNFKSALKSVQKESSSETFMGVNVEMNVRGADAHLLASKSNTLRLLYESGLYILVLKSRAAGAREFRRSRAYKI